MAELDEFRKHDPDESNEEMILDYCSKYSISAYGAVKLFSVLAGRQLLNRFLNYHEL